MNLVDIEYHKPCSHYDDGYHRKRSGWYTCECGASSAWHTTKPVERCVHGKIDGHPYTTNGEVWAVTIPSENIETCPGAGIGGDDE